MIGLTLMETAPMAGNRVSLAYASHPPQAAYDLAQGCWVMGVQVRWDAELGQWRGDAYWDDDLNLWLVK